MRSRNVLNIPVILPPLRNDGLSQRVGYGVIKSYAVDSDEKKSLPLRLLMFKGLISCVPRSVTPLGNAQPANRNQSDARPPYVTSSAAVALAPPALIFSASQRFERSRRQAVTSETCGVDDDTARSSTWRFDNTFVLVGYGRTPVSYIGHKPFLHQSRKPLDHLDLLKKQ